MIEITLSYPEGWAYVGWQRVVCTETGKFTRYGDHRDNVSVDVYRKFQSEAFDAGGRGVGPWLAYSDTIEPCLFVRSGESFTLDDFAELVREATGCEVLCGDG